MGWQIDFNYKDWNHGYLGIALLIAYIFYPSLWLLWPGIILVVDEIIQMFIGQYNGLIHWIYIHTLYKFEWVRKFDTWFNEKFRRIFT